MRHNLHKHPLHRHAAMAVLLAGLFLVYTGAALAASTSQRLVAIVNDHPITDFDISQRIRLNQALGYSTGKRGLKQRKAALKELVDDVIKTSEGKRKKINVTDKFIDDAIERMAKRGGTDTAGLTKKLRSKGVSINTLKRYVKASIIFRSILSRKNARQPKVNQQEVDRRFARISKDPRLKPVVLYILQEISLPVEQTSAAMAGQLFYARAVEASQIIKRYRGCHTARRASQGIFNVKISRRVQAPARRLPPQMKRVLDKAGTKRLIGPTRYPGGIRLIGFCGIKRISPQMPTRQQIENMLLNEKFGKVSEQIMRQLRRRAYIDYKDLSLKP